MEVDKTAVSVSSRVSMWRSQISASCNSLVRTLLLTWALFQRERCMEKAAALTYSTLLALVPLLAIMFALLKGLGVHNTLEPLLLKYLSSGSDEVVVRVLDYINNTNVGSLGAVGLVTLLLTVLFLLSNVEKAFNRLWHVRENRSWFRRFADYFSVISFGPLFLLAAISMSSSLRSQTFVQWILQQPLLGEAVIVVLEVTPFLVIWAAFIFLYLFMPNTRVRFSSAAVGGITAGTLWLITQWGYVSFQIGVGKYNAIYGTMAALPVFMIWLYIGWMIALGGGALSRAWQGRKTLTLEHSEQETRWHPLQVLVLLSMLYRRFQTGQEPWREAELLSASGMASQVCLPVLDFLERKGVLVRFEGQGGDVQILPQYSAASVNLEQLLAPELNIRGSDVEGVQVLRRHWETMQNEYLREHNLETILKESIQAEEHTDI
ncbi:MAG: YihY/virulence factor BrkB family protein [Desulfuromonadaceae bacterium]|nr:YihY/virulence factor BrkB family protein [Desulfuromonadaceae bacterium]